MTMAKAKLMMEKMGWCAGKGLGKNETGISKAIRPAYQTSKLGLGFDKRKDDFWWEKAFDEAAKNINVRVTDEVQNVNKGTKKKVSKLKKRKPIRTKNSSVGSKVKLKNRTCKNPVKADKKSIKLK